MITVYEPSGTISDQTMESTDAFERLNAEIAGFKPLTEEECESNWKDLVARLKAGEDIPGVALTPNGNVAYLFLD